MTHLAHKLFACKYSACKHSARALAHAFLFTSALQSAAADGTTGQFCWALGKLDGAVYFAGIEGREDRSASFASLIEISAIEADPPTCETLPTRDYRALRQQLVEQWAMAELEVIDTTFLSDLDY